MSKSTILAQCDMVLSVSSDTINYQFSQLWKRNVIEQDWKLLVRVNHVKGKPPTYDVVTQQNKSFDTILATWQATQKEIADLFAAGKYSEFGTKLAKAKKEGLLWDYGWSGSIAAPTISILEKTATNLLFNLTFKTGTLYYCPDPTKQIADYDLSGVIYAFDVPIGTIEISDTKKILTPEAEQQISAAISQSGLNQSDFTIESLFMEFENANISNFDESASKFPENMTTALQITVEDYFKLIVARSNNPYILGYGLKIKPIQAPNALFQPTDLKFSTSYSSKSGKSAFNFLMMLSGRTFPPGQNVGILPQSLLLKAADDPSIDGILAIDFNLFQSYLLEPFVDAIKPAITKGFNASAYTRSAQKWSLNSSRSATSNVSSPPSDLFKDTHMVLDMGVSSIIGVKNGTSDNLLFDCNIEYTLDIKIRPWELLHAGRVTVFEAKLSTGGTYKKGPDGSKGQPGMVEVSILPGAQGAVDFNITKTQIPEIGYTKKPYVEKTIGFGIWAMIQSDWNADSKSNAEKEALKAAKDISKVVSGVKKDINKVINSLSVGKVVLPLGQVYTYQNIQLYTDAQQEDNPVLLNAAYAPVS